jgi:branched-chain amino acid transport system permease protein
MSPLDSSPAMRAGRRSRGVDQLLQHLLNALVLGTTYALLGIGLTFIFGIMRVVNFAHGELYTFGAYMLFLFSAVLGVNFFVSIILATLLGALLGAVIELLLLSKLRSAHIDTTMLVMIGAWIILQNMEQMVWGGVAKSIPVPFPDTPISIGPASVALPRVFVFVTAAALIVASQLLIQKTRLGKAMRATFQDRNTAALMGVNINAVYLSTFALGSGLAAAAGALLGPIFIITPQMGDLAVLKAFAIVILGGLGNMTGAAIGGIVLALVEEFGAGYVSSGYRDAMGFLLIIVVLMAKPTGLFARAERIG